MIAQALRLVALVFVGGFSLVLVRTRDPARQVLGLSAYGMLLAALMLVYAAPDVALSQIVVGALIEPLLIAFALAKVRRDQESERGLDQGRSKGEG